MKLTILGSGTCAVTQDRGCASYLLQVDEKKVLLDIGFGALRRLAEAHIDYRDIDVIFCTHFHLDHIGDLSPFLMATHFTPGFDRKKPLTLIGPRNFESFLSGCRELYGDWLLPESEYQLDIIELESEQFQLGNCLIRAKTMNHIEYTNGYRIENSGHSLAYSGDTGPCEEIINLCQDVDLALLECSFPDEYPFEFHLTPGQVGEIAHKARVKKCLLTHFYPIVDVNKAKSGCAALFSGDVDIAQDLQTYKIE